MKNYHPRDVIPDARELFHRMHRQRADFRLRPGDVRTMMLATAGLVWSVKLLDEAVVALRERSSQPRPRKRATTRARRATA